MDIVIRITHTNTSTFVISITIIALTPVIFFLSVDNLSPAILMRGDATFDRHVLARVIYAITETSAMFSRSSPRLAFNACIVLCK